MVACCEGHILGYVTGIRHRVVATCDVPDIGGELCNVVEMLYLSRGCIYLSDAVARAKYDQL